MKNKKFVISIAILMLGQAFLYWFLKIFQSEPNRIIFFLDDKIPFIGYFVYIYNTFYPFVFFSLYLLFKRDEETYFKGVIAGVIGYIICDIIFLVYPTIMVRPEVIGMDPLTNFVLKITYLYDEPALNCFPSVHCLFCFQVIISYLFSNVSKKRKIYIITFSILIIISTVLVKQHYFFDMVGALVISLITNFVTVKFKLYNKLQNKLSKL